MLDLSSLRFIASVGEPLNPEAVVWGNENYGMPIHDNWWQTDTGWPVADRHVMLDAYDCGKDPTIIENTFMGGFA